jgi:uncharacterized protein YdbL (DUF1318 family)
MAKAVSSVRAGAFLVTLLFVLSACVTINIYFPAAAAEEAAERIVEDVLGTKPGDAPPPAPKDERGSYLLPDPPGSTGLALLDWLIPVAHAAPDFDVDTPAIRQIQARMKARTSQLRPFYQAGAAGFGNNGLVVVRDASAVSLRDRAKFDQLVKAENADRNALYREIAKANGHPEWEPEVRGVFAKQWKQQARSGWWVQSASGKWSKK